MGLTNSEFEAILSDTSKRILENIEWQEDEDHSPAVEFRVEVKSTSGWPLFVCGSFNQLAGTLTYAMILKTAGRVYALDLGKDHHNPQCNQVGEKHKHRWTEQFRDKEAYVPPDITTGVEDPVTVWQQFCAEANITHHRTMETPKPPRGDFFP